MTFRVRNAMNLDSFLLTKLLLWYPAIRSTFVESQWKTNAKTLDEVFNSSWLLSALNKKGLMWMGNQVILEIWKVTESDKEEGKHLQIIVSYSKTAENVTLVCPCEHFCLFQFCLVLLLLLLIILPTVIANWKNWKKRKECILIGIWLGYVTPFFFNKSILD